MKTNHKILLIVTIVFLSGCASSTRTLRTSPTYDEVIKTTKVIAVMPPDVKVNELTAGGVTQEIDEWSQKAKEYITEALKKHLSERFNVQVKFIEEPWLKKEHKELWRDYRSLYDAVSYSALMHAYPGIDEFPYKKEKFDYTLGADISQLSSVCGADAVLFIWGFDIETSTGRKWVEFFDAAVLGVSFIHPSALTFGLVNGKTGDLEWYVTSPGGEYNFRNEKQLDGLVEWMTQNYVIKKQ